MRIRIPENQNQSQIELVKDATLFKQFYLVMNRLTSAEKRSGYCSSSERTCSGCSAYRTGTGPRRLHSPSQTAIWTGQALATMTAMLSISRSGLEETELAGRGRAWGPNKEFVLIFTNRSVTNLVRAFLWEKYIKAVFVGKGRTRIGKLKKVRHEFTQIILYN